MGTAIIVFSCRDGMGGRRVLTGWSTLTADHCCMSERVSIQTLLRWRGLEFGCSHFGLCTCSLLSSRDTEAIL